MEIIQQENIIISPQLKALPKTEEEKQTIVHCRHKTFISTLLRIWLSTYLVENSGRKAKLLSTFDISLMPEWHFGKVKNGFCYFTLVFEGLSSECDNFYLDEIIPEPNGFYTDITVRNMTDVYEVEVFAR